MRGAWRPLRRSLDPHAAPATRQGQPDIRAVLRVGGAGPTAVGARHRLSDRQSEPAAAVAVGRRRSAKALEGAGDEALGKPLALVEDVDLHVLVGAVEAKRYRPRAVAQGVVNHA